MKEHAEVSLPSNPEVIQAIEAAKAALRHDLASLIDQEVARRLAEKMAALTGGLPDRLLTAEEIAEYLQVSRRFVFSLAADGQLVRLKLGRATRFTPESVRAYVRNAARQPRRGRAAR